MFLKDQLRPSLSIAYDAPTSSKNSSTPLVVASHKQAVTSTSGFIVTQKEQPPVFKAENQKFAKIILHFLKHRTVINEVVSICKCVRGPKTRDDNPDVKGFTHLIERHSK
jgi:hypothetical protein